MPPPRGFHVIGTDELLARVKDARTRDPAATGAGTRGVDVRERHDTCPTQYARASADVIPASVAHADDAHGDRVPALLENEVA
jgi:hypothetical protein